MDNIYAPDVSTDLARLLAGLCKRAGGERLSELLAAYGIRQAATDARQLCKGTY